MKLIQKKASNGGQGNLDVSLMSIVLSDLQVNVVNSELYKSIMYSYMWCVCVCENKTRRALEILVGVSLKFGSVFQGFGVTSLLRHGP